MKPAMLTAATALSLPVLLFFITPTRQLHPAVKLVQQHSAISDPKIQVAVLLDVSNSMDGLINQAKSQLWHMVNILGKADCNGKAPSIEIALYEYGRSTNDPANGYVKQISRFSTDLDSLSQQLFSLTTNGGEEYCGHVIHSSLDQLEWDTSRNNYKVIFIAGNEDFLQGDIAFTQSCAEAKKKGVIVNTIYCGNREEGIREHWNLGLECGSGSYANINADQKADDIITPYDSALFVLNEKLNSTYVSYLSGTASGLQVTVDKMNSISPNVAAERIIVKGNAKVYKNANWDAVDAIAADSTMIQRIGHLDLPDSLKNKNVTELKKVLEEKANQRDSIQRSIGEIAMKREAYINAERIKNKNASGPTLETEIEKIIKKQAGKFGIVIK